MSSRMGFPFAFALLPRSSGERAGVRGCGLPQPAFAPSPLRGEGWDEGPWLASAAAWAMALLAGQASLERRCCEAVSSPCREPTYFLLLAQEKGRQRERHPAYAVPACCALRARTS